MNNKYFQAAKIAYWYFRLNGFLNIENFVIHPEPQEKLQSQKTEADFYGVRFPYRKELDMTDDDLFEVKRTRPLFMIAEVTRGPCKLNGPWVNKERKNIDYVLSAIGAFPNEQKAAVAASLYDHCVYPKPEDADKEREFQLIAVGKSTDAALQKAHPHLLQITLEKMLTFMYQRFRSYRSQKKDHSQWDDSGQALWTESEHCKKVEEFVEKIIKRT
jgi:hypothetical protein